MIELAVEMVRASFRLDVTLSMSSRVTVLFGHSGAGKTSLLEAVAGLQKAARGRIVVEGVVFLDSNLGVRLAPQARGVGYVPQEPALFPHLDVQRNVRYGLRTSERVAQRDVAEIIALLDLQPLLGRYPRTLSGGEAQRVALARALVIQPRVLLLDEPLAALDAELKGRVLPYLMRVRDETRIPIIYVTHHVGEALALADDAIVLGAGTVRAQGSVREVLTPRLLAGVQGDATFENIVRGHIVEQDRSAGTATLAPIPNRGAQAPVSLRLVVPGTPGLQPGAQVTYRIASEDILLLRGAPLGISARNVFPARVVAVAELGQGALVRLDSGGLEWAAALTLAAVRELAIEPGAGVWLAIKTHTFERLGG